MEDAGLLKRYAANRDANAFAELVRRYAGMVYGTSVRLTKNGHDAEDVAQECFLELARNAHSIKSSLPGWLHKVARRRTIDFLRKSSTRARYEDKVMSDTNESKELNWETIAPHIDEALENIPEKFRNPIILHYLAGMPQEAVARDLGLNQSTVSRHLEKGIKYLRRSLKKSVVISSVTALTALLAENALCSAPATLMTALGKMAIAGIGASAISAVAGSGIGTAVAVSTSATASTGIIAFLTSMKFKVIAVLVAGAMIGGGIIAEKKKAQQITKKYKEFDLWIPGMLPTALQEDKNGYKSLTYQNGKVIRADSYIPASKEHEATWMFNYDDRGRIEKVIFEKYPDKNDDDEAGKKIEYTVKKYDNANRPVVVDAISQYSKFNHTFRMRAILTYNSSGKLESYRLYTGENNTYVDYTFEYDSAGIWSKKECVDSYRDKSYTAIRNDPNPIRSYGNILDIDQQAMGSNVIWDYKMYGNAIFQGAYKKKIH